MKVSVIIPIYKVEAYLKRCVDSVRRQTYQDIEIILVDDGSPDQCPVMCDKYAKEDSRIHVIHKGNGGLSDARNAGISIASGEYITFVDSDDYIAEVMIEKMLELARREECALVQCAFKIGGDDNYSFEENSNVKVMESKNAFCTREMKITACAKLYHRTLLENNRFPVEKINEDEFFTYRAIYEAGKVALMDAQYYYYYQSNDSITRGRKEKYSLDFIDAMDERIQFFREKGEKELVAISYREKCIRLMLLYIKCKKDDSNMNDTNAILTLFRNEYSKTKSAPLSLKERFSLSLFHAFPNVLTKIVNILRG